MEKEKNEYQMILDSMPRVMSFGGMKRIEWLRRILRKLGDPDLGYPIIHIAGTNGKGSVGGMTTVVMKQNNYKVGHFASPAIWDDLEQISINNHNISQQEFIREFKSIKEQIAAEDVEQLSIFEWFVLIALRFFNHKQVDLVVLEVGLGGMEDATNAIQRSLISVITSVSYDHTNVLGKTIKRISEAKSGIIRSNQGVILAPQKFKMVKNVVQKRANALNASVFFVKSDRLIVDDFGLTGLSLMDRDSQVAGKVVKSTIGALYQIDNLATVLSILDRLKLMGWRINQKDTNEALATFSMPARYQLLRKNPTVILDGAHNVDGIKTLLKSVKAETKQNGRIKIVFGVLADKDYVKMSKVITEYADDIFLIRADNPMRSLNVNRLKPLFKHPQFLSSSTELENVINTSEEDDTIVITGSFYVAKEFKKWIKDL